MMGKNNLLVGIAILIATTACAQGFHLGVGGEDIARAAERHHGSTDWAKDKRKDNFPEGTWKCNLFVYDVLKETGVTAPVYTADGKNIIDGKNTNNLNPVVAADWANLRVQIPDWNHRGTNISWQRGDIVAIRNLSGDATGHCGIAVSSSEVMATTRSEVTRGGHGLSNGSVRGYTGS